MTATIGVIAALLSAISQAIAHALLAGGRDKLAIRGLIGATGLIAALPLTLLVPLPTGQLWYWLLASGVLHAIYQLTLIKAYADEDFSVAYPLARGIVPLATAILGVALLGDKPSPSVFVGVALVSVGLVFIAIEKRPAHAGMVAAVFAGLLTTGYTLLDAHAVRISPAMWTFIVWFFIFDGAIMSVIIVLRRRRSTLIALRKEFRQGFSAGIFSLVTYSAALVALRFIPTGSVAAIRETSIVFGAIIASVFLKEHLNNRRRIGIAVVAIGGIVVAL
ncbi:MAG: DMT family transporter [Pseudomonadota bacterium]